eukprot:SAG31_NODE_14409_length_808_cov_0.983075_1_plen_22_part_10
MNRPPGKLAYKSFFKKNVWHTA